MDEHIDPAIVRGLLRVKPSLEIVLASRQFVGWPDQDLLEWAAQNGYLLVTRDINTLVGFAYQRIEKGQFTEGILVLRQGFSIGQVIRDLLLMAEVGLPGEWSNQILYLPLT